MTLAKSNVSRRGFVTGSAVGALALLGGLAGCASGNQEASSSEQTNGADSTDANSIAANNDGSANQSTTATPTDVSETVDCDIVVVGAGISGLAAAVQAAQDGNKVIVLEKAASAGGNGSGTEGVFAVGSDLQKENGIAIEPMEIIRTELSESQWRSNGALWVNLVNSSAENIDWLQQNGVEFSGVVDNYHTGLFPTMHWFKDDAGAVSYVPQMQEAAEKAGAEFRFKTPAKSLVTEDGNKVVGVYAEDDDGNQIKVNAKAVILASGGIGANPELLLQVGMNQEKIDNMLVVCIPTVEGDGYLMTRDVNAGSYLPNSAIQAFQGVKAFGTDTTPPYSSPLNGGNGIVGCGTCIWVNQDARRFSDESLAVTFNMAANAGACLGNRDSYAIFDQSILDAAGLDEADQKIVDDALAGDNKDSVMKSDDLSELAKNFGLDPDILKDTVDLYNSYCDAGIDGEFGKDKAFLKSISAPYYMAKIINQLVVVDGSIITNIDSQVVTADFDPIPGLYAVGLDGAMLWHNMYTQNMPGTVMANNVNSGRTAAKHAGEYIKA